MQSHITRAVNKLNHSDSNKKVWTVAIDTSVLDRTKTGTAVYVNNLLTAFSKIQPTDMKIITISGPRPRKHKNFLSRPINLLQDLLWLHVRLPLLIRKYRVNLLHMPANYSPWFFGCSCVVSIHDAHFITHTEQRDRIGLTYFRIAVRIAIAKASMIITDSLDAARMIETHLHVLPESLRVVYLGATQRKTTEDDRDFGNEYSPFLLFTGATEPHKNVHSLVEAFAKLVRVPNFSDYKLVIAGVPGGGHQRVLDSISRNHLDDKVVFPGFITDSKLSALYEKAELFVFPSNAEGFGLPPLEAMGHGTPVAAANASCIPEILGDAAEYFDPDDPDNIEQVIRRILESTENSASMAEKGKVRAAEFTWERCAHATLDVYREVLVAEGGTGLAAFQDTKHELLQ